MKENRPRGTWGVRLLIHLFTLILAILIYWLLGFVVQDVASIKGPDYELIERQYLDQSLIEQGRAIDQQSAAVARDLSATAYIADRKRNCPLRWRSLELRKAGGQSIQYQTFDAPLERSRAAG